MAAGASGADPPPGPAGEARWPAAGAVLAAIGLTFLLPAGERVGPGWVLPAIEVVLLAAIVVGDPGSLISMGILALVVARAVNVFT